MPGPVVVMGATITCPHGGPVQVVGGSPRVLLMGMPAATLASQFPITGCPFQVPIGTGTKPQPCVKVQWIVAATRVQAGGSPLILQTSTGICQSIEQIPQGPPAVSVTQTRVVAI